MNIPRSVAADWDRRGLPAWTYHSPALLDLEVNEVFLTHWQIAGHVSDLGEPGRYITLDIGTERAIVVCDEDGTLRAFHNICRHRGSRLVTEPAGRCRNALVCPFHGWVYNFDGSLRGPARPHSFGKDFDRSRFGLRPIEVEVWQGFVFLRFRPGPQGSVAEAMAHFGDDLAGWLPQDLVPTDGVYTYEIPVNWKSVRDVDNEGYHVAMAHPALQDLYGATYVDEPWIGGTNRATGRFNPHAGRRWSVRNYVALTSGPAALGPERLGQWAYYGLFPNSVIAVTPETIQFYQEFPLDVGRSLLRGAVYRRPEEDRRQRLARYLAKRIDMQTYREDIQLSVWSNEAMRSPAFEGFHLSDLERGVRSHHDCLRRALPVMTLDVAPPEDRMVLENERLRTPAHGTGATGAG